MLKTEPTVTTPPGTPDDVSLFAECLTGDNTAAGKLFVHYNPRLFAYSLRMLGDAAQAEDVTQDVWRRVIDLRRAPMEVRNPMTFLLTITRNLCIDAIRKRQRFVPLDEEAHLPAVASGKDTSEYEEIAVAALDILSPEYRETIVLNIYCGYRFDEIAAIMGCSPEAVWQRASRARAQLRRIVAEAIERSRLAKME